MTIDVARLGGCQEGDGFRQFARLPAALRGIELPDHLLPPLCAGGVVERLRHARFDKAGTYGVDAYPRPGELLRGGLHQIRSEEHTSELQSLMRISYAVFCLKKKNNNKIPTNSTKTNN